MLAVLAEMFRRHPPNSESPYLLDFVTTYLGLYPHEAGEIVDVLLDLSHGVFVDEGAAELWRKLYLGALHLDLKQLPIDEIQAARARWHEAVCHDPQVLYARLGPQIPCTVPARKVRLVLLGREQPVRFDLNTVPEGILRLIPDITEAEIDGWQAERRRAPFADVADFRQRVPLSEQVLGQLEF
jgi:hypothetical protein